MKLMRHLATTVVVAALAGLAILGSKQLTQNTPMPDVPYTPLEGAASHTGALKGQVVLINFWSTSCSTCVKEMPQLVSMHQQFHPQGYETLAVAMQGDAPAHVANFAQSKALPFTVAIDNLGQIAQQFGNVQLTPTTFLVNRHGKIVKRYVGEPDFVQLKALIAGLLVEAQ